MNPIEWLFDTQFQIGDQVILWREVVGDAFAGRVHRLGSHSAATTDAAQLREAFCAGSFRVAIARAFSEIDGECSGVAPSTWNYLDTRVNLRRFRQRYGAGIPSVEPDLTARCVGWCHR